jgi:chromosome partitioning protein
VIIGVFGQKGGTGKSTVATNLATYLVSRGDDVLLLDADPQGTSYNWAQRRKNANGLVAITCLKASGDIYDAVRDQAKRYNHVVIDAGGADSDAMRSGILASNIVYVPLQPSVADIETSGAVNTMIGEARRFNRSLIARAIISRAPTNPMINETQEAREALLELSELELSRIFIRDRKVYRDALLEGAGVVEMSNNKATAEIQLLGQEILATLEEGAA